MERIKAIATDKAPEKARQLLEGVHKKLGMTPNMMRTMAHSPAVLNAYLSFSGSLAGGSLPAKLREQIALTVGEVNGCQYCLSAHSALGQMAGLSQEEILDSRRGESPESKSRVALRFARKLVTDHGHADDQDLALVRKAGFTDGEITEIVANVALNLFTNYFNHVADPQVDFPAVVPLIDQRERQRA